MTEPERRGDPLLTRLVRAWDAATEAAGPSLVLHVGGTLLTGTLVPAWHWAQEERETLRAAVPPAAGDPDALLTGDAQAGVDEHLPTVIHLADARTLLPSGVLFPHKGVWWRGLLSRVDGWSFGTIALGPSSRADDPPQVW